MNGCVIIPNSNVTQEANNTFAYDFSRELMPHMGYLDYLVWSTVYPDIYSEPDNFYLACAFSAAVSNLDSKRMH